ncbi:hypothetical protein [Enteractinococcus helveticum]|uniref:hypothetical protein n=1 Tax=Enteractinococcus helveticum TaxID=1837282 RepID=UPI000AB9913A|nr:hypothetical protein [Enteractinococcus helveticum]
MKHRNLLYRVVNTLRPAAQPVRPAVLRLSAGAFTIWNNMRRRAMFRTLHAQDASSFYPVGPVKVLRRPLPPTVANVLFDAAQVTNVLATLGVAHRVTGPVNAALQLWTLSYRNSWGMIFHNDNMALLHQMVLGTTRSADALSVDALVKEKTLTPQRFDRAYGGIPTAMNIATVAVYCISGVAKVRSPQGGPGPKATPCVIRSQPMRSEKKSSVPQPQTPQATCTTPANSSRWPGSPRCSLNWAHPSRWSIDAADRSSRSQPGACTWASVTLWELNSRTTPRGSPICPTYR